MRGAVVKANQNLPCKRSQVTVTRARTMATRKMTAIMAGLQ
jgi:hypothetical protein